MTENVGALSAMRANEGAHVLDQAEHWHVHPAEHVEPLARVDQRQVLRRRYDDGTGERNLLRHGELGVASARRHVDYEHIEFAPGDILQHLGQRRHHHWPPPDHRRLLVDEETHGHHLEAVGLHRIELVASDLLRLAFEAQEPGHRGAVDVGVEHADPQAFLFQRDREIDGDGRLTDAAFAGGDGDDVGDSRDAAGAMARVAGCTRSRERRALWGCSALAIAAASGSRRTISRQRHGNGIDARQRRDGLLGRYAQGFELARSRWLHLDGEIDLALVDHDLGNEALGDDVVPEIGAFDALKRLEHALFGERFGHYAGYLCLLRGNTNCLVAPMFTD